MSNVVPTPQPATLSSVRSSTHGATQTPSSPSSPSSSAPSPRRINRRLGAIGFIGAVVLGACATQSSTPAQAQLGGSKGKTVNVSLAKLKFNPKKLEIKKGDSLNFVWKESVAHNVVFDNKGPKSKTLNKGAWLTKMDKPGVFKFKCTLHPGMDGVVAVK